MKISAVIVWCLAILIVVCAPSGAKPTTDGAAAMNKTLTANKWNMIFGGKSYGTIQFSANGTCTKAGTDGVLRSNGTWKLDGNRLTLSFPDEGAPFTGTVKADGKNLVVAFADGKIVYTYTPAR